MADCWMADVIYTRACSIPADTRRLIDDGLTLVQRRRRWTNGKPTLIQHIVSAGITVISVHDIH